MILKLLQKIMILRLLQMMIVIKYLEKSMIIIKSLNIGIKEIKKLMKTICLSLKEGMMTNNPYKNKCLYSKKWQLVDWATKRWPNQSKSKFNKMKKKQLYVIYYSNRDN